MSGLFVLQALTDQQQFGKADEMYDKCIELEPDNATTYVHKGSVLLPFQEERLRNTPAPLCFSQPP